MTNISVPLGDRCYELLKIIIDTSARPTTVNSNRCSKKSALGSATTSSVFALTVENDSCDSETAAYHQHATSFMEYRLVH